MVERRDPFDPMSDNVIERDWGPIAGGPKDDFDSLELASTGLSPSTGQLLIPPPADAAVSYAHLAPVIPIIGRWWGFMIDSMTSGLATVSTRCALPVIVPKNMTVDRIGMVVSGGATAGQNWRLGIYRDNGDYYPGALVLDAGTVTGAATGIRSITISQVLTAGLYWLVSWSNATSGSNVRGPSGAVLGHPNIGWGDSAGDIFSPTNFGFGYVKTGVTQAALADPYPAGDAANPSGSAQTIPEVALRRSA